MLLLRRRRVKNPLRLRAFKEELLKLYYKFKMDVEAVCEKHGAEINYWYSPSSIPQPKFVINGFGFDADQLFNEEDSLTKLFSKEGKSRKHV